MDVRLKIPNDIVYSIFLELPVKSLLRFKNCCKSWRCCIDDAYFIKSHLHKSSGDISRQKIILVNIYPQGRTRQFKTVSTEASISGDSNFVYLEEPNIPGFYSNYFYFEVFSCSGLVFMISSNPGISMILWNPAVRKYNFIPNSLVNQNKNPFFISPVFGFAYDFVAEDYKVLCVHQYLNLWHPSLVEVYSVKNQCWRTIHNLFPGPPDSFLRLYDDQVSLNGVIYRLSHNTEEYTIISFHLVDEIFTVTIVPSTCGKRPTLHALGDRVCVFTTVGEEILIWSLEKHVWNCINKFPTLLSLIGRPNGLDTKYYSSGNILCVKANGNILWRKDEGPFMEYDMRKNEYTEFKSPQVPKFRTNKALYVESLVSAGLTNSSIN